MWSYRNHKKLATLSKVIVFAYTTSKATGCDVVFSTPPNPVTAIVNLTGYVPTTIPELAIVSTTCDFLTYSARQPSASAMPLVIEGGFTNPEITGAPFSPTFEYDGFTGQDTPMIFTVKDQDGKLHRSLAYHFHVSTAGTLLQVTELCNQECLSLTRDSHDTIYIRANEGATVDY